MGPWCHQCPTLGQQVPHAAVPEPQHGDSGVAVTGSVGGIWGVRGSAGAGPRVQLGSWSPVSCGARCGDGSGAGVGLVESMRPVDIDPTAHSVWSCLCAAGLWQLQGRILEPQPFPAGGTQQLPPGPLEQQAGHRRAMRSMGICM